MLNIASLINLLGFTVGVALYALLFAMILRHRRAKKHFSFDFLLLTTAVLGFLWNVGELYFFIQKDFSAAPVSPLVLAVSYSALGFLPSVVVHYEWKNSENKKIGLRWLTFAAYGLSLFAGFLHFQSALFAGSAPSASALQLLTFGALGLLFGLLVLAFRQTLEKKAIWITALLILAAAALHLSSHREESSWPVELVAHQSSLPLALAILLQDYRFAFADLFLKRALSLLLLAAVALGLYVWVAVPLLAWHETHERNDVPAAVIMLALWMATALIYSHLHRFAVWFVDKIILRRVSYEQLEREIAQTVEKQDDIEAVLNEVCGRLKSALTARKAGWKEVFEREGSLPSVNFTVRDAEIFVPASAPPFFEISLDDFSGGRNLLSDEIRMLEAVALLTARRIDNLRATHERYELEIREQEFSKLATEAQLSALRAQINPHFLFNALTTIGYLIQTSPDKALQTLLKLTALLRGLLRAGGEFSTLGEEMKLIESYLEIEKARFEERLQVTIDVPKQLENLRVPALILQPLVENAIKHGISENKSGGRVRIAARLEQEGAEGFLKMTVGDTGAGRSRKTEIADAGGVGLKNIRQRLLSYYGQKAQLNVRTDPDRGTSAEIKLPVSDRHLPIEDAALDRTISKF